MDPAFQVARQQKTGHSVLGLELYPLTIGHVFLLCELGIDFLVDDKEPELEDLILFAFVASQKTETQARRVVYSRFVDPVVWIWGLVNRRRNIPLEIAKLHEYIKSQSAAPKLANPPPNTTMKQLNAPEHWRLLAMLIADFHMTVDAAMNCTLNFARALWGAEGERRDKHSLAWDPRTSRAIEELKSKVAFVQ